MSLQSAGSLAEQNTVLLKRARAPREYGRLFKKTTLFIAIIYLIALVIVAIFAWALAPYDPLAQDVRSILAPLSAEHWLGTDAAGRDVLSRLMFGARPALVGTCIALVTASLVGIPWGLAAGYFGGILDQVLMRLVDAFLIFPGIVLALVFCAVLGANLQSAMIAIGLVYSPVLARVVRASVLSVANTEFVLITRLYGVPASHRMWLHVLPNALAPTIVQLTLLAGAALQTQTGLSFLGVGTQPPWPAWGTSLAESFRTIIVNPAATIAPGCAVVLTVLAIYRIGDELRDRLALSENR